MKTLRDVLGTFLEQIRIANPDLSDTSFKQFESSLRDRISKEPAPRLAIIGDAGVGKSSTINALFNAGQAVGHSSATTMVEHGIRVDIASIEAERGEMLVYDMPGVNESIATRSDHLATYARVLTDVDVALWVLDAQYRAIEHVQQFLRRDLRKINPSLTNRIVFALNKVDLVHPGPNAWHPLANLPSPDQRNTIEARVADVRRLVLEALPKWQGTVIGYSAERRYNLPQLFAAMMDAVARKRQWVLHEHKALADFLENVDGRLVPEEFHRNAPPMAIVSSSTRNAVLTMSDSQLRELLEERKRRSTRASEGLDS